MVYFDLFDKVLLKTVLMKVAKIQHQKFAKCVYQFEPCTVCKFPDTDIMPTAEKKHRSTYANHLWKSLNARLRLGKQ